MFMEPSLALNHVLNFIAPAFWLALMVVGCAQMFFRKHAKQYGWITPIAINFAVGCAVLWAGLWIFGNDGKLLTYSALTVARATTQWALLRGWKA